MSRFGALQLASASTTWAWSLAAGAVVVLRTRARAAERRRRLAAIEDGLGGMFRSLEKQPVPRRLQLAVEMLEKQAMSPKRAAPSPRRRKVAAAS